MTCICPLCGNQTSDDNLFVLNDRGLVAFNGMSAYLTPKEMQVFEVLRKRQPRVVTKDSMLTAIYGMGEDDEPEIKIIDVIVCKIRKKLEPLGVKIETAWGHGYFLQYAQGIGDIVVIDEQGAT